MLCSSRRTPRGTSIVSVNVPARRPLPAEVSPSSSSSVVGVDVRRRRRRGRPTRLVEDQPDEADTTDAVGQDVVSAQVQCGRARPPDRRSGSRPRVSASGRTAPTRAGRPGRADLASIRARPAPASGHGTPPPGRRRRSTPDAPVRRPVARGGRPGVAPRSPPPPDGRRARHGWATDRAPPACRSSCAGSDPAPLATSPSRLGSSARTSVTSLRRLAAECRTLGQETPAPSAAGTWVVDAVRRPQNADSSHIVDRHLFSVSLVAACRSKIRFTQSGRCSPVPRFVRSSVHRASNHGRTLVTPHQLARPTSGCDRLRPEKELR